MKKFIVKVFIFVLLVGFISVCVNFIYIKRDHSDPQSIRKFQNIPSSVKVCNFGSSHGLYGFNYDDVEDVDCFNFALSSQVLSYDRRVFEHYKDSIAEGAVVFIPVSFFSLYGNDERNGEAFLNKNKRYYQILSSELIKEYDFKTDIYVNFPSLTAGVSLVKILLIGAEDTNDARWSRLATDIDVQDDAEKACQCHIFLDRLDDNGNRIINEEEIEALKYLINACYEKGCTPILITTPFLSEYTEEIKKSDPDFLKGFYDLIDRIVEETGVTYFDYGVDDRFANNYEWFMDSDHLNKDGAREFVNILMNEVIYYGTDESLIK